MNRRNRKQRQDAHNHERWLVSYADFVTLLFAFFVVMYSISAVNEEKYKSFSKSLESAFFEKKRKSLENEEVQSTQIDDSTSSAAQSGATSANPKGFDLSEEKKQLQTTSEQLANALQPLIKQKLVSIKKSDFWIELELNSGLLFLSGDAQLSASSLPLIKKIAAVFKPLPNTINVEGHTDNNPIRTIQFPSNWELSSVRATRVVQELIKEGIEPSRLSAIGYGEFHPVADNRRETGRFKNRRVVILLISQGMSRYGSKLRAETKVPILAEAKAQE